MTNSEKYLKEGTDTRELWVAFQEYYYKNKSKESDAAKAFKHFFEQPIKPTLTEDERVILKNVGTDYQSIERDDECLWVRGVDKDGFMATCYFKCFDHLFQFIKERRRIFY